MFIFDSHAHLKHGDARRTEYTAEQVIYAMDGAGISRSVVFAMATTTRRAGEMAAEAARRYPDRLVPYAYALPHYERAVADELEAQIRDWGFRGIKLHVGECSLAGYVSDPVFALAGRYGVPCLVDFGGRLETCREVLQAHPHTNVIIAHFGRYLSEDALLLDSFIGLAETYPNALLDASGVVLGSKIEEAARRVGAERILFGTDGPHTLGHASAEGTVAYARAAIERIEALSLDLPEKEAILGGNIARLLGV
ncbi:MAG: amidohydrolase [Anaerolineae bacterium]|nr:amidohydrolase [Anaerolineae bacterium]